MRYVCITGYLAKNVAKVIDVLTLTARYFFLESESDAREEIQEKGTDFANSIKSGFYDTETEQFEGLSLRRPRGHEWQRQQAKSHGLAPQSRHST